MRALAASVLIAALAVAGCAASSRPATPIVSVAGASLAPTPTASPSPVDTPQPSGYLDPGDWPVYHLDAARTGNANTALAPSGALSIAWTKKLDGAVYAEPLVVHGQLIVATEGDSLYSIDPGSGTIGWHRNLGTPVALSTLPCGDIDPLGITGTPAYDPNTNLVYAVAEVTGPAHILFALDADTGAVAWSLPVDLPGHDTRTQQQRAALGLASGYVYVAFGGLAGDCGQYLGNVVGVSTDGSGPMVSYTVPAQREAGIWSPGGPAIDSSGNLYVPVGNGSSTGEYDGSDSVVKLAPDLHQLSFFAPAGWADENARDADLGSMTPALLDSGLAVIAGKGGTAYVLNQSELGGIGGEVSSASVCAGFGGAAVSGATVFLPCNGGVAAVGVSPTGQVSVAWTTSTGAGGPPVLGGGLVWTVNISSGRLFTLDPATGKARDSVDLGPVPHFVSPTLWKDMAFVGTTTGIAAVHS